MVLLLLGCGSPGPLQAQGPVVCSLANGASHCRTVAQDVAYPTEEGVPARHLESLSMGGQSVCGIDRSGGISCGGFDEFGLLAPPVGSWALVAVGHSHACAVDRLGEPTCWGANYQDATSVPEGVRLRSLAAGDNRTCGQRSDSEEWVCWGASDFEGRFGYTLTSPEPGTELEQMVMGGVNLYGVRSDGTLAYWGDERDSFGRNQVPEGDGYVKVDVGLWHACALHSSGRLDCWGDNSFGQQDAPEGAWSDFAAGEAMTCGRTSRGDVVCWGCGGTCTDEEPDLP